MIVLGVLSPFCGLANTLPLSFIAAIVNPKKSVIDDTRIPLLVSWKSTCPPPHSCQMQDYVAHIRMRKIEYEN